MTPKKVLAFVLLTLFVGVFSGCGTCKGAAEGFKKDWESLKRADRWVQKNIW
jgi:hypothetical protein